MPPQNDLKLFCCQSVRDLFSVDVHNKEICDDFVPFKSGVFDTKPWLVSFNKMLL